MRLLSEQLNFEQPLHSEKTTLAHVDSVYSFALDFFFDKRTMAVEEKIARSIFCPQSLIVLIPRHRPTLAYAVTIDEFLASRVSGIRCSTNWNEAWRTQEETMVDDRALDGSKLLRISSRIALDPFDSGERSVDLLIAIAIVSHSIRIKSSAIVYDEALAARSPVTLYQNS